MRDPSLWFDRIGTSLLGALICHDPASLRRLDVLLDAFNAARIEP